jgi:NADH-quinone oxidoreductase subunit N
MFRGEYYVLGLFGMLGMMIMVSAHSFLTIYLGLELLSLSLYAMVAFDRNSMAASESAMKYFVLGAIASGMLLYGMSMIYGVTGTLDIRNVANAMAVYDGSMLIPAFGVVFIVIGLSFKLGAVPFHMWVPDVYHGSPTSVTLYIGSAPKIAGFALFIRLLVEGLGAIHTDWQQMLIVLSVLSLGIGNIVAIAQTNIKRMLAYSTISHVGFILLGLIAGTSDGFAASGFYVITYAITSMGAFAMIILLSRKGFEAENIDDFRGLNARHPWYAFLMLLLMFSMAGVPPTVGFYAKLLVLKAVVDIDLVWLAIVAVLFSVIGAFYYLRIIKVMYFDTAEEESIPSCSTDMHLALSVNGLAILFLGLFPGGLIAVCSSVF